MKNNKKIINSANRTLSSELSGIKNLKVRTIKLADKNGNLIELLYFLNAPKKKTKTFYNDNLTVGFEFPFWKSFEIDTNEDFLIIESIIKNKLIDKLN